MNKGLIAAIAAGAMALMSTSALAVEQESLHVGVDTEFWLGMGDTDEKGIDRATDGSLALRVSRSFGDVSVGAYAKGDLDDGADESLEVSKSNVWVQGSFGRVVLGRADNAANAMHVAAPDVGYGVNDTSIDSWIVDLSDEMGKGTAFNSTFLGNSDRNSVSWYSPVMRNVRVAATYVPEGDEDMNESDEIFLAASYSRAMGDVGATLSAGVGISENDMDERDVAWSAGLNVDFKGLVVGGSLSMTENGMYESMGWDAGASYAMGSMAVSLVYQNGWYGLEDDEDTRSERRAMMASLSYDIANGVKGAVSAGHVAYEPMGGEEIEGMVGLVGVSMSF